MISASLTPPVAVNEPVLSYAPQSPERAELKAMLQKLSSEKVEIPAIVAGQDVFSGKMGQVRMPHRHAHVLAQFHHTEASQVSKAIASAMKVKAEWANTPLHQRAAIFLRAAELLATRHRALLNGATMLGQSKTAHQAEIDAACEGIDFLRFNVAFANQLEGIQPISSAGMWNQTDYRPLDGFVFAVAPFNFTAISLNLCTAPALMGNVVLFKPAETSTLSSWYLMQLLKEAGLPDGVIQFLPGDGAVIGAEALASPELGGIHFTGSTATFQKLWKTVGDNIGAYRQYPRLVGETGGKDFIFAHPSAVEDLEALAVSIVRGGFEFQGQKCSAASRLYIPESLWPKLKERLVSLISEIKMGDVTDFQNFMGAVIDEKSFHKAQSYIELAKGGGEAQIVAGGKTDKSVGYFVEPTLVQVSNPRHRLMREEIFAPIISAYVYPDAQYESMLKECDEASPYALTGAIWARSREAIATATTLLRHAAGNFYINDKPTGAVVGQQPFGGGRASGTNDKAGSMLNLLRWTSPRTVKETFVPPTKVGYPFMSAS